jgi:arabinan endo-1,5-alpha-L-arabinosidase
MRMFRAESVEGPYVDMAGNEALSSVKRQNLGVRVMDNYKFSFMDTAYTSCGGNSATQDTSGKTFLQFHQKYADGTESHTVRTHQTFLNEDGWLVTAPFEYNKETIADQYLSEQVAGDYEMIYHRTSYKTTSNTDYDYADSEEITLHTDGTVTGAYEGVWSLEGHNVTIEIEGHSYKGVVLEMSKQTEEREETMVFTAIGDDNRTLWGCKK